MTFTYENITGYLNLLYENTHKSAYIRQTSKNKKHMLSGNARLFSRFFHSTLVKNTLLSPANILCLANKHFGNEHYHNPNSRIVSHPKQPYDIAFTGGVYSADNHPVLKDIRLFIERISPGVNLNKNKTLPQSAVRGILGEMTVCDAGYLEFICLTTVDLNLTTHLDGVHVTTLAVTEEADAFFELPPREALLKVINSAASSAAFALSMIMPGYSIPIETSYIMSLLKSPNLTRDIYAHLFITLLDSFRRMLAKGMEFDIVSPQFDAPKKLTQISEQELFAVFTSCSFILNASYIRSFITVFADYLKLINPFFEDVLTFRELQYYISSEAEIAEGAFLPPAHYTLTPVALDIFDIEYDPQVHGVIDTNIPFAALIDAIPTPSGKAKQTPLTLAAKYAKPGGARALRLKITLTDEPSLWKTVEFSDQFTLEQLHFTICCEFLLEPAEEYSFNTNPDFGAFTSYTPSSHKAKHKKTHKTRLCDLPLDDKSVFYYCLSRSFASYLIRYSGVEIENDIFEIEVTKIKPRTGIEHYPLLIRESPAIKEMDFLFMDPEFDV